MNKILLVITILLSAGALSGCETVRYTVTGPFVGLSKDMQNTRDWIGEVKPAEKISNADAWVQKNLW